MISRRHAVSAPCLAVLLFLSKTALAYNMTCTVKYGAIPAASLNTNGTYKVGQPIPMDDSCSIDGIVLTTGTETFTEITPGGASRVYTRTLPGPQMTFIETAPGTYLYKWQFEFIDTDGSFTGVPGQVVKALPDEGSGGINVRNDVESASDGASAPAAVAPRHLDELGTPLLRVQIDAVRAQMNQVQARLQSVRQSKRTPAFDAPGIPLPKGQEDDAGTRWGTYVAGLDDWLRQAAGAGSSELRSRTTAVTVGGDYRLTDEWVLGMAAGFAHADVRFSSSASRQTGRGGSAMAYVSWNVSAASYISATASYQDMDFDIQRDGGIGSGSVATSRTRGIGTGLSLSAGHDFISGSWSLSPYARLDTVTSRLRGFDESGSIDAVSIGAQRARSDTASLGADVHYSIPVSWGVVLPHGRVEISRRSQNQSTPTARLLSDNSTLVLPTPLGLERNYGAWALGVSTVTPHGMSLFFDYETGFGQAGIKSQRIVLGLRHEL